MELIIYIVIKRFIMEEKIKSEIKSLNKRLSFLEDFANGKRVWVNETNGLTLHQQINKIQIEISILEKLLD